MGKDMTITATCAKCGQHAYDDNSWSRMPDGEILYWATLQEYETGEEVTCSDGSVIVATGNGGDLCPKCQPSDWLEEQRQHHASVRRGEQPGIIEREGILYATSTGVTVKDDPAGYLHALVLDTEFDENREKQEEGKHDGCKLAADVFAKISPEDYGKLLEVTLREFAPEVVNDFLDYLDEEAGEDHDCEMDMDTAIFAAQAAVIERQLDLLGLRLYGNDNTEPGGTWLIVDRDDHTVAGGHAGLTLSQVEAWITHHPGYPGVPVAEGTALAREILRVHEPEALAD